MLNMKAVTTLFIVSLIMSQFCATALLYKTDGLPSADGNSTITIGYYIQSGVPRAAAIGMAIDQATAEGLLPGYTYRIEFAATSCVEKNGTFGALDMLINSNVDVIFGPFCSTVCQSAGFVASYYKHPMFPEYCSDLIMDDKVTYDTLIRMAASWSGLAETVQTILTYHGWQRVVVLNDQALGSPCTYGTSAIVSLLDGSPVLAIPVFMKTSALTAADYADYLSTVQKNGRVVICCHSVASIFSGLIQTAQDMNMTNGDYAFYTFGLTPSQSSMMYWTRSGNNLSAADLKYRMKAYYAVKQIYFEDFYTTPSAIAFLNRVLNVSTQPPWNYPPSTALPSFFAQYLYDAVYMYIKVVDKVVSSGGDYRNGATIFFNSRGINFTGVSGKVVMNEYADRLINYDVWTLGPENSAYYRYMTVDISKPMNQRVTILAPTKWGLYNTVPDDVPACGFRNELCPITVEQSSSTLYIIIGCIAGGIVLTAAFSVVQLTRMRRAEAKIHQMMWKISYAELVFVTKTTFNSQLLRGSRVMGASTDSMETEEQRPSSNGLCAVYRSVTVTVEQSLKNEVALTRQDLIDLVKTFTFNHF